MEVVNIVKLPAEVLLIICSNLSSWEKYQLSLTCKHFKSFLEDSQLNRSVDLSAEYTCTGPILNDILKPVHNYVFHLDLTSCYWLTSSDIYKCVSSMVQLQCLYAADTQLSLRHVASLLTKLTKMKRLSFNWSLSVSESKDCRILPSKLPQLKELEFLYLNVVQDQNNALYFQSWIAECKKLKELWVISYDCSANIFQGGAMEQIVLPELNTLVINSIERKTSLTSLTSSLLYSSLPPNSWRCLWLWSGCLLHILPYPVKPEQLKDLEYINPLQKSTIPFCTNKLKHISVVEGDLIPIFDFTRLKYLNLQLIGDLEFNGDISYMPDRGLEALLCHCTCTSRRINEFVKLLSLNSELIRCSIQYKHSFNDTSCVADISQSLFTLSTQCQNLTELELGGCSGCEVQNWPKPGGLSEIFKLKNLQKLTLKHLLIQDAKFLIQITSNCTHLKSIALIHLGLSGHCMYMQDVCNALQNCVSLKDFRIEHKNLGRIDHLLQSIEKCPLLERVVIKSSHNRVKADIYWIIRLIEKAHRLIFFVCSMASILQSQEKEVNRTVKQRFLKERPALIVKITSKTIAYTDINAAIHFAELMSSSCTLGPNYASVHITGL